MLQIIIPFWVLLIVTGILNAILTIFAFRAKNQQSIPAFIILMSAVTLWSFGYAAELASSSLSQMLFLAKLEYLAIVVIAPSWFYFALCLNRLDIRKNKGIIFTLITIPAIILSFVCTNDLHHLFWKQNVLAVVNGATILKNVYGPVFWVHFYFSYSLIIGGTVLLLYNFLTTNSIRRYRVVYLLVPLFPLAANAVTLLNLNPLKHIDLTPFAFTITGLMLVLGASRRFRLELVPIAHDNVFENIEDGIIITDQNYKIVDFNPATKLITGFDSVSEIQSFILENLKGKAQEHEHVHLELNDTLNRPNVLARLTPLIRKAAFIGMLIILTDITPQKQAAKELKTCEERYEQIFTGMRDAIFVENFTGGILEVNPSACEMFGFSREEFLAKTVQDIVPQGAPMLIQSEDAETDSLSDIPETPLKTYNRRANGSVFPVEVIARRIIIAGEPLMLIVVRDITEKVKAETALASRERYLKILNKLTWSALTSQNLHEMLQTFADRLCELFEASAAYITFWDEEKQIVLPKAASGKMKKPYPKTGSQPAKNTMTEAVLKSGRPIVAEDVYNSPYISTEISLTFPAISIMALPLATGDRKFGAALIAFDNQRGFSDEDIKRGSQAADQIALSISRSFLMQETQKLLKETRSINETLEQRVHERTKLLLATQEKLKYANQELRAAYDATIEGWAQALELREKETAGHSKRTVLMSLKLAKRLNLDDNMLEHIRRGALLHDIGKMVIPDSILQKPGELTADEWKVIREHPNYSKKILGHIEYLSQAVYIPFYHHERWDGSGYPHGLKGEEIPLPARIFALVDVWDALSSDRPYRRALCRDNVILHIEKGIGTHFDPAYAKVFIKMLKEECAEEAVDMVHGLSHNFIG